VRFDFAKRAASFGFNRMDVINAGGITPAVKTPALDAVDWIGVYTGLPIIAETDVR
jgi:hypothetical protein